MKIIRTQQLSRSMSLEFIQRRSRKATLLLLELPNTLFQISFSRIYAQTRVAVPSGSTTHLVIFPGAQEMSLF